MRFQPCADLNVDPDEVVVDGYNEAHAFTEMVLGFEPGPSTMALLSSIDIAALDTYERACVLKAWERQQAWLMGQIQHVTVGVAGLAATSDDDWVREEVACVLGFAPDSVGQRIWVARTLVGKLPATMAALEFGEISWRHAYAAAELCGNLDGETAEIIEQRVLKRAGNQTLFAVQALVAPGDADRCS